MHLYQKLLDFQSAKAFDENGKIASSGKVIHEIVNSFFIFFRSFLIKPSPKSLDRNYFKNFFVSIIKKNYKKEDIMASFTEITAQTIAIALKETTKEVKSIIISGGGAYNKHLISRIKALISCKIIKTNQIDLNFIESELIAYLSARFLNNLPSTFEYTTGTNKPTIAGKEIIYNYKKPFLLSI